MCVENLAHGNPLKQESKAFSQEQVISADQRYTRMINSPRVADTPPRYEPPGNLDCSRGFCSVLSATLTTEAIAAASASDRKEKWYLLLCDREVLSSRENLVDRHIAVNLHGDGLWHIARVVGVVHRRHRVFWVSDQTQSDIRLVDYGFKAPPAGNGVSWRLVMNWSAIEDARTLPSTRSVVCVV